MVIGKSEIEWHDINELPREYEDILILVADQDFMGVICGQYESGELGFHIPDEESMHTKLDDVLGWAYFPIVYIIAIDKDGELNVIESR